MKQDTEACLLCLTSVSVVGIVFATSGLKKKKKKKKDPVLPAPIFVLYSKTENQQHAWLY